MNTQRRTRIGIVVDAQVDFSKPDGNLYVKVLSDPNDPGAIQVEANVIRSVQWMREHCDVVIFTKDAHRDDDPEIAWESPDFVNTFPPHCMEYSANPALRAGAEIIPEIRPKSPLVFPRDGTVEEADWLVEAAIASGREIVVEKSKFSVFEGNENFSYLLRALRDALEILRGLDERDMMQVYVVGHARDKCVTECIDGIHTRLWTEGLLVTAVRDAMWGLGLEAEADTHRRWREAGAEIIGVDDLQIKPVPA